MDCNRHFTEPSDRLRNVSCILARASNYQISWLRIPKRVGLIGTYKGEDIFGCRIKTRLNLSVMNTRNTIINIICLGKSPATSESAEFTQCSQADGPPCHLLEALRRK